MSNFRVTPGLSLKVINEDVAELGDKVPSSENNQFIFLGQQTCQVTTSGFRRVSFCFGFSPFKSIKVEFVEVVESSALVVDSSVASENDDFVLIVSHGVVGSGLWSSNLAHSVFRRSLGFLIGGLMPLEGGWVSRYVRSLR